MLADSIRNGQRRRPKSSVRRRLRSLRVESKVLYPAANAAKSSSPGGSGARLHRFRHDPFAGLPIKHVVPQELLSPPRRGLPPQILVEPVEVSRVVKRHFVPTWPVTG